MTSPASLDLVGLPSKAVNTYGIHPLLKARSDHIAGDDCAQHRAQTPSCRRATGSTLGAGRSRRSGHSREASRRTQFLAPRVISIRRREQRELFVGLQAAKGVATATTPNGFNSLHSGG